MIRLYVVLISYKNGNGTLQIQLVFRSQDSIEITAPPADRLETYFRYVIVEPACTPPITFNGTYYSLKSLIITTSCICLKIKLMLYFFIKL